MMTWHVVVWALSLPKVSLVLPTFVLWLSHPRRWHPVGPSWSFSSLSVSFPLCRRTVYTRSLSFPALPPFYDWPEEIYRPWSEDLLSRPLDWRGVPSLGPVRLLDGDAGVSSPWKGKRPWESRYSTLVQCFEMSNIVLWWVSWVL